MTMTTDERPAVSALRASAYTCEGGTLHGVALAFPFGAPSEGAVLDVDGEIYIVNGRALVLARVEPKPDTLDVAAIVEEWRRS